MLYVTTRNRKDCYTAYRSLHEDRAPDGGLYAPFHLPVFREAEILSLKSQSQGEIIARILNLFFACRLSGWDVETCIGKTPVRLAATGQKTIVAETWHVLDNTYSSLVKSLYEKVCGGKGGGEPSLWFRVAARIAILFAAYGSMMRSADFCGADISVNTGDFCDPAAAWYARKMGLPVGIILCSSVDNSAVWDLIRHGECSTVQTKDAPFIESLLLETCSQNAAARYGEKLEKGSAFQLTEEELAFFGKDLFAAVISKSRIDPVIRSVYSTSAYPVNELTAISLSGIRDYRAHTGINTPTLVFADSDPRNSADTICRAAEISREELYNLLCAAKE